MPTDNPNVLGFTPDGLPADRQAPAQCIVYQDGIVDVRSAGGMQSSSQGASPVIIDDGAGNTVIPGTLTVTGAFNGTSTLSAPTTVTTDSTVGDSQSGLLVDATSAPVTITLPVTPLAGLLYFVKKIDSSVNAVTVQGSSGNIDGNGTATLLTQYDSDTFCFDGANWWIV